MEWPEREKKTGPDCQSCWLIFGFLNRSHNAIAVVKGIDPSIGAFACVQSIAYFAFND